LTTLPTGSVVKEETFVNTKSVVIMNNINETDIDSNDFLEGIRVMLNYILSENRRKRKRKNS